METTLIAALIAGVVSLSGAVITGRLNRQTVKAEKTLPPYDALAARVSALEKQAEKDRMALRRAKDRADCLEERVDELSDRLDADRAWIRRIIAVAESHGTLDRIRPLPDWLDAESDSMRQQRDDKE